LRSLVAVVDPSFKGQEKKKDRLNPFILWATKEGLDSMKKRIEHIGTVEVVDNAKEIEEARALGDLRENSEYKFALERRSRLQRELKTLSEQIQKVRVITEEDIECDEIGIGNVVDLVDASGEKVSFTILGPWEADPEEHILSSQSQLAQEMMGKGLGDTINYKNEEFSVKSISKAI
jgi:transcription elongation GreA/GreB family factor